MQEAGQTLGISGSGSGSGSGSTGYLIKSVAAVAPNNTRASTREYQTQGGSALRPPTPAAASAAAPSAALVSIGTNFGHAALACLLALLLPIPVASCHKSIDSALPAPARPSASAAAPTSPFLRGQLHAHTSRSSDSQTPPEDVVRWYASRGYDFIVFTDHNRVTNLESPALGMLLFPGVEITQNSKYCEPPPEGRLRCLLHVNGLFVSGASVVDWSEGYPTRRLDIYGRAVDWAVQKGGIAQLNHPNFHYALTSSLAVELARRGAKLLEIANEASDSNNAGDAHHPSTEQIWDEALSQGVTLWGVASDDAHHYYDAEEVRAHGKTAHVGDLGFVMVRAPKEPQAIRAAIEQGQFYSSKGVLLDRVEVIDGALRILVAAASPGDHHFRFIGRGGQVLRELDGREASMKLSEAKPGYVRAVVQDGRGRKAWVQPVPVP